MTHPTFNFNHILICGGSENLPHDKVTDRKTVDLRIPVTPRQKEMICAALRGEEFARWAREMLLREAGLREERRVKGEE